MTITYRNADGREIRKVRPSPRLEASPRWERISGEPSEPEPAASEPEPKTSASLGGFWQDTTSDTHEEGGES